MLIYSNATSLKDLEAHVGVPFRLNWFRLVFLTTFRDGSFRILTISPSVFTSGTI